MVGGQLGVSPARADTLPPLLAMGRQQARPDQRSSGEYRLWQMLPGTALLPTRVTAADARSICHELIPLSLRHSGKRNGGTFPTY